MAGSVLPIGLARRPPVTKDRILDAAESLFMEHGFEATSLRAITAAAGVNLASVNYHFGSKEELFQAVLTRRLDPMNQERARSPDAARARSRTARRCACERILSAMFVPALKLARDPERGGKNFLRLLGRAYADPAPFIRQFLAEQYAHDDRALQGGVRKGAPGAAEEGALVAPAFHHGRAVVHARGHRCACSLIAELTPAETGNDEALLQRLAPFLLAGLQSPVPDSPTRRASTRSRPRAGALTDHAAVSTLTLS